jgi:hypothetical protein
MTLPYFREIFEPHDQHKYPQGMTCVTYYMPVKSNSVNIRLQEINMLKDETIVVSSNRQKLKDKTDTVCRKSAAHALGCGEGTHTRRCWVATRTQESTEGDVVGVNGGAHDKGGLGMVASGPTIAEAQADFVFVYNPV